MILVDMTRAGVTSQDSIIPAIQIWIERRGFSNREIRVFCRVDQNEIATKGIRSENVQVVEGINISNYENQTAYVMPYIITQYIRSIISSEDLHVTSYSGPVLNAVKQLRDDRIKTVISLGVLRKEVYSFGSSEGNTRITSGLDLLENLVRKGKFDNYVYKSEIRSLLTGEDASFETSVPGEITSLIEEAVGKEILSITGRDPQVRVIRTEPHFQPAALQKKYGSETLPTSGATQSTFTHWPADDHNIGPAAGVDPASESHDPLDGYIRTLLREYLKPIHMGPFRDLRDDLYRAIADTLSQRSQGVPVTSLISDSLHCFLKLRISNEQDVESLRPIIRHIRSFLFTLLSRARVLIGENGSVVEISRFNGFSEHGIAVVYGLVPDWITLCERVIIAEAFSFKMINRFDYLDDVAMVLFRDADSGRQLIEAWISDSLKEGRMKIDDQIGVFSFPITDDPV